MPTRPPEWVGALIGVVALFGLWIRSSTTPVTPVRIERSTTLYRTPTTELVEGTGRRTCGSAAGPRPTGECMSSVIIIKASSLQTPPGTGYGKNVGRRGPCSGVGRGCAARDLSCVHKKRGANASARILRARTPTGPRSPSDRARGFDDRSYSWDPTGPSVSPQHMIRAGVGGSPRHVVAMLQHGGSSATRRDLRRRKPGRRALLAGEEKAFG